VLGFFVSGLVDLDNEENNHHQPSRKHK